MTTATRSRKTFTAEETAAYRSQQRETQSALIEDAVQELLDSDGWQRWVAFRSRLHRYSFSNSILISLQCPDATIVQSFKKWREAGRHITSGPGSAIRILAPLFRKPTADEIKKGADPERKILIAFKLVPVFDVSQTDGEPVPVVEPEPITGDSHAEYIEKLEALAVELEYSVSREDLSSTGAGGYCDSKNKRIVLHAGTPANDQVHTLIHEIAHALGVGYEQYGRRDAEVIVETATHIVCSGIGLESQGFAAPYIASWGEANRAEAIRKFAETVDEVARKIEVAL